MKGWIKVHGYADHNEKFVRASEISSFGSVLRADNETEAITGITLKGDIIAPIGVDETCEEVLALIEEAEGERSLYEKLREVQGECKRQLSADMSKQCGCETCSYFDTDESWLCDLLRREKVPCDWDLDMIPEEYR